MGAAANDAMGSGLRDRLRAWWHGYDVDDEQPPLPAAKTVDVAVEDVVVMSTDWSAGRIAAVQQVFGPGEDAPAAMARTAQVIKPLGLSPEMSVLEIGCGLGVGLRAVAGESGAWIDGVDPNPEVTAEAEKWIGTDGLLKKAVPSNAHPLDESVTGKRRDAILSRDGLHRYSDRKDILAGLREVLKPKGQVLITDFMVNPEADATAIDSWIELHAEPPVLLSLTDARDELTALGLDVRVAKDESTLFAEAILDKIQRFAAELNDNPVPAELQDWVVWEAEYWARTMDALQSGALRHGRLHAVAPPEM